MKTYEETKENYMKNKNKIWGINILVETIQEHDKLLCGYGNDTWETHVLYDDENKRWNREQDYLYGKKTGHYEN